jgi:hypothetical protein
VAILLASLLGGLDSLKQQLHRLVALLLFDGIHRRQLLVSLSRPEWAQEQGRLEEHSLHRLVYLGRARLYLVLAAALEVAQAIAHPQTSR